MGVTNRCIGVIGGRNAGLVDPVGKSVIILCSAAHVDTLGIFSGNVLLVLPVLTVIETAESA